MCIWELCKQTHRTLATTILMQCHKKTYFYGRWVIILKFNCAFFRMSIFISVSRTNQSKYWKLISWAKRAKKSGIDDQTAKVQIEPIWNGMSSTNKTTLWLESVTRAKRETSEGRGRGGIDRKAHAHLQIKTIIDSWERMRSSTQFNLLKLQKMRANTRMIHISIPFG